MNRKCFMCQYKKVLMVLTVNRKTAKKCMVNVFQIINPFISANCSSFSI